MKRLRVHRRSAIILGSTLFILALGTGVLWFLTRTQHTEAPAPSSSGPTAEQQAAAQKQLVCIDRLPLETALAQKVLVAAYTAQITDEESVLWKHQVNGVILMDAVPASLIRRIVGGFRITPTIAVDQEGGTVQRYTEQGILPGATEIAKQTLQAVYRLYKADNEFLAAIGITTNFAPVVDVQSNTPSPLPDRMFSNNPDTVSVYAQQAIMAAQSSKIAPVMKHFPGLGSASGNTDFASATTSPLATLKTRDTLPYQKLAPLQADIMISNAITPDLTDGQPAVWSKAAINLARGYGYENAVIYSDSLTAEALSGSLEDATVKAWRAGIDVALIVQTKSQTPLLDGTLQAIIQKAKQSVDDGEMTKTAINASVARIFQRKQVDACSITP